ncbi:MAG: hypothetical protein COB93_08210, partial [Sneathiella sp.]
MKTIIRKLALGLGMSMMLATSLAGIAKAETVLKWSAYFPADNFLYKEVFTPLMREIEQESKGEIKFEEYSSGALGKITQQYDLLKNGLADMSMYIPSYSRGRFPLSEAGTLPFAFTSARQGTLVLNDLVEKWLAPEQKNVKLLFMFTPAPAGFLTRDKPVASISDLQGMKMRSAGAVATDILKLVGANVVTIPLPEIYTALERGVVEGTVMDPVTTTTYKLYEPAKNFTPLSFSSVVAAVAMNQRSWDNLTSDQQVIVNAAVKRAVTRVIAAYTKKGHEAVKTMQKAKVDFIKFPADERERFVELVAPMWVKWAEEKESEGDPAKAFMVDFE